MSDPLQKKFANLWVNLSSLQLLSCVRLFASPWIAGCQASLSITISRNFAQTHPVGDTIQPCFWFESSKVKESDFVE